MNEEYQREVTKFKRPIPGMSLTNDPADRQSHEKAPEFTVQREAIEYIYTTLIDEEVYIPLLQAVKSGIPVTDMAQSILFKGFAEGKWNPDLMLLLIEPSAYMIMALAVRAGIDYKIYTGEQEDDLDLNEISGKEKKLKEIQKREVPPISMLPVDIQKDIETREISNNLLDKPEIVEENNDSLLSRENV